MEPITIDPQDTRLETLCVLRDCTLELGYPPSLKTIAAKRRLSIPGVKKQLDKMAADGLLTKLKNQPKTCVLTEDGRRALKNWLLRQGRKVGK